MASAMHLTASLLLASLHPQPLTVRFPCLQVPLILQLQRASRQETLSKRLQSVVGGRGGGKPAMAQAGGSNAAGIDAALEAAKTKLGA